MGGRVGARVGGFVPLLWGQARTPRASQPQGETPRRWVGDGWVRAAFPAGTPPQGFAALGEAPAFPLSSLPAEQQEMGGRERASEKTPPSSAVSQWPASLGPGRQ